MMRNKRLLSLVLLATAVFSGFDTAFADSSLEKLQQFQQQALACGADLGCIQKLALEMQAGLDAASPAPTPPSSPSQPQPQATTGDKYEDPCTACREQVAWMGQNGSVARFECKPLSVDLVWDFTQEQMRTPVKRIGPSSSVSLTLTESYPGCAKLAHYQNAKAPLSHAELSAPAAPAQVSAKVTAVNAIYGLSRPYLGLPPRGDEFNTATSADPNHYAIDLSRREFGLDYQCNELPGMGETGNVGTVLMPTIDILQERIVPAGDWHIIINPELGYKWAVDLNGFLSCRQIHAAFDAKTSVEHTFPFKQVSEVINPPGTGERTRTVESIEGTVKVRVGFEQSKAIGSKKPKNEKKPGKLVVSSGAFEAHRKSPKDKYQPRDKAYTLTNNGEKPVVFGVKEVAPWLDVDTIQGTLQGGQSTTVNLSLTEQADELKPGRHQTQVQFNDFSSGGVVTREAVLSDIEKWRYTIIEKYDLFFKGVVVGGISPPVRNVVSIELEGGKFKSASASVKFGKMTSVSKPAGVYNCDPDPKGTWIEKTAYPLKGWVQGDRVHLVFPKNAYHLEINCVADRDQLRDAHRDWYKTQRNHPNFKNIPENDWNKMIEKWAIAEAAKSKLIRKIDTKMALYPGSTEATHISVPLKKFFTQSGVPTMVDYSSQRMERLE